jgi:hypothetical protein
MSSATFKLRHRQKAGLARAPAARLRYFGDADERVADQTEHERGTADGHWQAWRSR